MTEQAPPKAPGARARAHQRRAARERAQARRRRGLLRLCVLAIAATVAAVLVTSEVGGSAPTKPPGPGSSEASGSDTGTGASLVPPAIEAGLEPWKLNAPLSRSVVLPAADGRSIVVAGGLLSSGGSAGGVYEVDPATGADVQIGSLLAPEHDAGGVVLGGHGYIFGGGSATPTPSAERLPSLGAAGGQTTSSQAQATALAPLPAARADDSAVTIGGVAYVIGGYDGSAGEAAVLATADGKSYRTVAHLPVPVRYGAVTTSGGLIYVFGGDATAGALAGRPVRTVQMVNPLTHAASIVGELPKDLAGAAAVTLRGVVYLAGGETTRAGPGGPIEESGAVYAWSTRTSEALLAGHLMVPVAHAGIAVLGSRAWLVGGETAPDVETSDVQMIEPNHGFGSAGKPGAGSPYFGDTLLIADRGNDRLLALNDSNRIVWTYPSKNKPAPPGGFYFPDDAFFTDHGTEIISNQEGNDTLVRIAYPSGKVLWTYGHPHQPGSSPGYLDNPDDAYLLRNGDVTVADPKNCRVLVISPSDKIVTQIGAPGSCTHQPPRFLGSPNGDTPLADGDLLVSEINGSWIDEYTLSGRLVWSTHLAIGYPSDPQPLGGDRYLVADYENPGAFIEFNRAGKILFRYGPASGTGELNRPSLVEHLPSGVLMANDDYNDRLVAVDPATGALVWQYGRQGVAGTAPGLLAIPDGFDLVGPTGAFPTHPTTG